MRLAYADPPYIGQARRHYLDDPKCAEVDHEELIARLAGYDGWALSASSPSLRQLLPLCPPAVRVAAWVKPFSPYKPGVNPAYCWEPMLFVPSRKGRTREKPHVKDWLECASARSGRNVIGGGVTGRKPENFCFWLFGLLRAESGDELDDLFPGSGAVTAAWNKWSTPLVRLGPHGESK